MIGKIRTFRAILVVAFLAVSLSFTYGQRFAIFAPSASPQSSAFVERLAESLEDKFRIIDSGAAQAAFNSVKVENPYNLTTENARSIGTVIGSDHFVLIRAATQRRTSSARPMYYEAYAVIYLVNSRTGLLELWHLESKQGDTLRKRRNYYFWKYRPSRVSSVQPSPHRKESPS